MFKCLVSGGCSFAYGFNLPDRTKRYSQLLANNMNVQLIDTAAAGMTNEFIAAATISGINKALAEYQPEEILVTVGWTSSERFELFDRKKGLIRSGYVNAKQHRNGDQKEEELARSKYISDNMWDPAYGFYKFVHAFMYLHSFCKAHNIRLIHKQNVNHNKARFPKIDIPHSKLSNKDLVERCLVGEYLHEYEQMCTAKSFQLFTTKKLLIIDPKTDTHPNIEGHKQWADRLIAKHPEFSNKKEE